MQLKRSFLEAVLRSHAPLLLGQAGAVGSKPFPCRTGLTSLFLILAKLHLKSPWEKNALAFKTVWPSGLRRWLKAPFRKGVGSNPKPKPETII